jgi:formiminoglutamase
MIWNIRYRPPEPTRWQGRADAPDASYFFQIVQLINLLNDMPLNHRVAFGLIGFCCDEGIRRNLGRIGATEGPTAIRAVLGKLSVQKRDIICYDVGDITCTDGDLESAQQALGEIVAMLLQHGITPIVLGGGHELAWGNYQGIRQRYPNENLGIINFDAHFDMRPLPADEKGNSGTPFLQIANAHQADNHRFDYNCIGIQPASNIRQAFETANNHHVQMIFADDLHQGYMNQGYINQDKCTHFIDRIIHQNQILYLTLCLDVLATPYAPGVSAPQSLGLTPWQLMPLVRQLAKSGKVVSYDIAELSPKYDTDLRTAKLAACFIYEIIHNHTLIQ